MRRKNLSIFVVLQKGFMKALKTGLLSIRRWHQNSVVGDLRPGGGGGYDFSAFYITLIYT